MKPTSISLIQRAGHRWIDFGLVHNIYWRLMEADIEQNEIDNLHQQNSKDETVVHNSANLFENLHTNTNDITIWSEEEKKRLVEINLEKCRESRRLMGRMKRTCCREFPH